MESSRFIGVARTTSNYKLYDCGTYPALVASEPGALYYGGVWGELYEVDDSVMAILDAIEGIDSGLYERAVVNLSDFSLVNLPFDEDTVDFLEKKITMSYVYLQDVSYLEECGAVWSPRQQT